MRKERKTIQLNKLHLNSGQLGWLPRNPRQWTRDQMDQMVASLNEDPDFMQDRPPLVVALPDKPGHFVVFAGNERTQGEKERKAVKELDCIVYEGDFDNDPDDRLTVIRRAIKDNGHYAKNDTDIIANEWAEYADQFAAWGNPPAWDVPKPETASAEEDDFDEETDEVETRCQPGDIWKLGEHRLMCGDSTDSGAVALLMNGEKADMVFTDPPYGVSYQSNMRELSKKFDVLKNDDTFLDFIPAIKNHCRGFVFICTTWKVLDNWLTYFQKHYKLTNMVVWDKGGGGIGDLNKTFLTDYEIVLVANNNCDITGKRIGSVWSFNKDNPSEYRHPTQKPIALAGCAIENTTNKGASVLDVFGGSGSTLIAAEQLGRRCYMMELDPHYCDVIIARWEKLTGRKARKIN